MKFNFKKLIKKISIACACALSVFSISSLCSKNVEASSLSWSWTNYGKFQLIDSNGFSNQFIYYYNYQSNQNSTLVSLISNQKTNYRYPLYNSSSNTYGCYAFTSSELISDWSWDFLDSYKQYEISYNNILESGSIAGPYVYICPRVCSVFAQYHNYVYYVQRVPSSVYNNQSSCSFTCDYFDGNIYDNFSYSVNSELNGQYYQNGYGVGYDNGYDNGYDLGYDNGYGVGLSSQGGLNNLVITIAETPLNFFKGIWDFDILGFNVASFCLGFISIAFVIWIIKKFI